jgi:NADH dehydrogenase [ubiquinone] 1 alpha subcomplex assembly factor 7
MTGFASRIVRLIETNGPISIAQFMTMALHDPEYGYYATRDPLGADFITAPEISQVFGELLGLWCAQIWHDQGRPSPARLVELGPGRGTLMADALRAARLMPEFLAAIEIVLVEISPVLQSLQKESLRACKPPIRWTQNFADIPSDRPLFLIANEFLDALPIRQFVLTERGWCERMVALNAAGALSLALSPAPSPIDIPAARGEATPGAVYEVSSAAAALAEDVSRSIAHWGGAAIFVDYGYAGHGFGETLQAVGAQKFQDVLESPGEIDLSAHVDFGAIGRAAEAGGARAYGPIEQGDFLNALGIGARVAKLGSRYRGDATAFDVERLTSPAQMGTLFKALAIVPPHAPAPSGF